MRSVFSLGLTLLALVGASIAPSVYAHGVAAKAPPFYAAITFAGANNGWVMNPVKGGTKFLHTHDGGRTWTRSSQPFGLNTLTFVDAKRGWGTGVAPGCNPGPTSLCQSVVEATDDGGISWHEQVLAAPGFFFMPLQFLNARYAWVMDRYAAGCRICAEHLYATSDGGKTWIKKPALNLTSLHFVSPRDGWMAQDVGAKCSSRVLASHNGGKTWKGQLKIAGQCQVDVYFVDGRNGWALPRYARTGCGASGCAAYTLYRTTDGGAHWSVEQRPPATKGARRWWGGNGFANEVRFATPALGWIPFSTQGPKVQGGIAITRDGGRTWNRSLFDYGIEAASLVSARNGWLVGCYRHGPCDTLLHTANGGSTWTAIHPKAS